MADAISEFGRDPHSSEPASFASSTPSPSLSSYLQSTFHTHLQLTHLASCLSLLSLLLPLSSRHLLLTTNNAYSIKFLSTLVSTERTWREEMDFSEQRIAACEAELDELVRAFTARLNVSPEPDYWSEEIFRWSLSLEENTTRRRELGERRGELVGRGREMIMRQRRVKELIRNREEELVKLERERGEVGERAREEVLWLVILAKGE